MLKFCVKLFRTSLFPSPMMDLVHVWYHDRYWSKILHSTIPTPIHDLKVKVTDLELSCLSFMLKFLGPHCFQTLWYMFHVWYDNRCWSKILCSMIPNPPVHDFKIKVTDLKFLYWSLCLSFYNVWFCEALDGLIHVWYGDRNWSKILYGTIPNPEGHRLRIFI